MSCFRFFVFPLLLLSCLMGAARAQEQQPIARVAQSDTTLSSLEKMLVREAGRHDKLHLLIDAAKKESDERLNELEQRFRKAFLYTFALDGQNFFALTYCCSRVADLHSECSGGNFPFYLTRKRVELAAQRYVYIQQMLEMINKQRVHFSQDDLKRLDTACETSAKLAEDYKTLFNELHEEQERFLRVSRDISILDRYANGSLVEKYEARNSVDRLAEGQQGLYRYFGLDAAKETKKEAAKEEEKRENAVDDVVKAYSLPSDLNSLQLTEEVKIEGRLAARIMTELYNPSNPFRRLNYNYPYMQLWNYVPLSFSSAYLNSTDPEFTAALGDALLYLLIAGVVSALLSFLLSKVILRRYRRGLSSSRIHAFSFSFGVLCAGLLLWGYILMVKTNDYLENNLSFVANYLTLSSVLFCSLAVRLRSKYVSSGTRLFEPFFVLNLLLITYCVMRCPTFLVRMTSPIIFLICGLWMMWNLLRRMEKIRITVRVIAVLSILLMFVGAVFCFKGYYFLFILLQLSWFVLVTNILLLTAIGKIGVLLSRRISVNPRFGRYRRYISLWLDLIISQMLQPLIFISLIWYGLRWPAQGFNLGQFFDSWMGTPYHFNGAIRTISADCIILIVTVGLALNCLLHIIGHTMKTICNGPGEQGRGATWLTLGSMFAWGAFGIFALNRLDADYNSILVVMGGMSVGVGLGLKDNIDNLIGGISLMLGRLRPGDVVECDGVRGNVVNIGCRTTSLETMDGSVIVFQNSQLFSQNFRNLTRNHQYERCVVEIGVTYGTDVDQARRLILTALRGIPELTSNHPSAVLLNNFGDSSVDLSIVVWVPVNTKAVTLSRVREAVYRTFNAHGIEIPFPQQDLYIKPLPGAAMPAELKG